ncbi:MAG: hypothetical protein HOO93_01650 [Methyloglobulus sp.]|nr:hypothetical protein [Methyloglobulus sp.]
MGPHGHALDLYGRKRVIGGLPPITRELAVAIYRAKIKSQIKGNDIRCLTGKEMIDR